jgi:hypothetical protein
VSRGGAFDPALTEANAAALAARQAGDVAGSQAIARQALTAHNLKKALPWLVGAGLFVLFAGNKRRRK